MILCQEGSHPHTEPYEISICHCSHCFRLETEHREANCRARGHMLSGRQQMRRPDSSVPCQGTFYVVQHSLFRKSTGGLLWIFRYGRVQHESVCSPPHSQATWLSWSYVWVRGGGLALAIILTSERWKLSGRHGHDRTVSGKLKKIVLFIEWQWHFSHYCPHIIGQVLWLIFFFFKQKKSWH